MFNVVMKIIKYEMASTSNTFLHEFGIGEGSSLGAEVGQVLGLGSSFVFQKS